MRNERGFVSLFTTIMLSLLLLVITMSLVTLEAVQLRKSEDSEQTLRAYYAAEAGIEEAAAKVLSGAVTANQTCTSPGATNTTYDAAGLAGWTCQQVSFSGSPTGILKDPDAAKTIDPGPAGYNSVVIEWNQSNNTIPGNYIVAGALPPAGGYGYAAPPLEVAIVQYPNAPFPGNTNLPLTNALIVPRGAAAAVIPYASIPAPPRQFDGNCVPGNSRVIVAGITSHYNCYAQITGLTGPFNYLFRVRSRYAPTSYKMTFLNGVSVVTVPDGTATIDVTAKAGDTYRRVLSKIPINGGAATGLNYVMYSDTNICKSFDVMNNLPTSDGCNY